MPPFKSEGLYSERRSFDSTCLGFFIDLPLTTCCLPSADDPNTVQTSCMRNNEQTSLIRIAEGQEPMLVNRMIWVRKSDCHRITKYRGRLFETYTMLFDVASSFFRIPLEVHPSKYSEYMSTPNARGEPRPIAGARYERC